MPACNVLSISILFWYTNCSKTLQFVYKIDYLMLALALHWIQWIPLPYLINFNLEYSLKKHYFNNRLEAQTFQPQPSLQSLSFVTLTLQTCSSECFKTYLAKKRYKCNLLDVLTVIITQNTFYPQRRSLEHVQDRKKEIIYLGMMLCSKRQRIDS